MTREEIIEKVYNVPSLKNMWLVSIVYKNAFGIIENNHCYFYTRGDAEKWFSNFVRNKECYYGYCCDEHYWRNVEQLYKE